MYISSPEEIKSFIINIPRGTSKSLKEMRLDLANTKVQTIHALLLQEFFENGN